MSAKKRYPIDPDVFLADSIQQTERATLELIPLFAKQLQLEEDFETAEQRLEEAKANLRYFQEYVIPETMLALWQDKVEFPIRFTIRPAGFSFECPLFTFPTVIDPTVFTAKLTNEIHVYIAKRNESQAFYWLRRNGHGDKIKKETKVSINTQSLKKIIREAIEADEITPEEKQWFGVYQTQKSILKFKDNDSNTDVTTDNKGKEHES